MMDIPFILHYGAAAGASFCYVFLKAFQQRNVMGLNWWWILPTSYGMAATEAIVIVKGAHNGFGWIVVALGTGGGLGALCAMWLHHRYVSHDRKNS